MLAAVSPVIPLNHIILILIGITSVLVESGDRSFRGKTCKIRSSGFRPNFDLSTVLLPSSSHDCITVPNRPGIGIEASDRNSGRRRLTYIIPDGWRTSGKSW
ncbi:uncharacterized protein BT62DRAFT_581588 [Guyanagaster necrorhizus]|uniref:Uncharacterized protein n=1 Tax=Guyanagaster necrorhizus TaxID=856835 RepID=A0A9P7VHC3_9AGAR|nr:uncharacterized protein BT62DRAFT_581588 [Guyanagaster necrorhizus MCA 3950]KAG7440560.1 hypothetical protein BT62DRAFT_581588 [Guyanagaster necrorhizus MCA 3950]